MSSSYDQMARFREAEAEADRRRQASLKKGPLTSTQLQVLEHLAAVAVRQKAEARYSKKGFKGGWTHVRTNKHVKLGSVQRLLDLGYASACCSGHYGTDSVHITKAGVIHLETIRGEEILA